MHLHKIIKTTLFAMVLPLAMPALATTTYTYTDSTDPRFTGNTNYSGSFSVDSALADGAYSFASVSSRPAGFIENFFATPFVDGAGVTRTSSLSVFNISITNGSLSSWDIQATTPFTRVSYSGGKKYLPVYHAAQVIFHDTTASDFQTYYDLATPYNIFPSGLAAGPGVWSVSSTAPAVPEPESYILLLAGLGAVVFIARRR